MTFGKGSRMCIAMHLANAEMARWNMRLFETDDGDVRFQHDYHVAALQLDSKGVRAVVAGSKLTCR